ncbi:hypothetical protein ACPV50_20260 [Vibrio astriarenae]
MDSLIERVIALHSPRTASIETENNENNLPNQLTSEEIIWLLLKAQKAHPIGYALFELQYLSYSKLSYQKITQHIYSQLQKGLTPNEIKTHLANEQQKFQSHLNH